MFLLTTFSCIIYAAISLILYFYIRYIGTGLGLLKVKIEVSSLCGHAFMLGTIIEYIGLGFIMLALLELVLYLRKFRSQEVLFRFLALFQLSIFVIGSCMIFFLSYQLVFLSILNK